MTIWIALLAAGATCFLFRLVPATVMGRLPEIPALERALGYVGPAAFAAIAAPAVLNGGHTATPTVARLLAAAAAVVVAHRTRSMLATLAVGMPVLWLTTALVV
jgi:branched-subunit amino acid transport protein